MDYSDSDQNNKIQEISILLRMKPHRVLGPSGSFLRFEKITGQRACVAHNKYLIKIDDEECFNQDRVSHR
jgi:hypothetical protein